MICGSIRLKFLLLAVLFPLPVLALTNNVVLTPPMGWNDWNSYHCGISESAVTNTANAIAANGMKAAGYQFVNIDDGWASSRDSNGVIQAYGISGKFPHGIKWLADYVHSKGLKLGIYTDHGTSTCSSCISGGTSPKQPGSYHYEYVDAFTYASWGVDYLKDDSCNEPASSQLQEDDYFRMTDGLMKSGRPIVFSLCENQEHYQYWSPEAGNLWRTTGDISTTFASMISKIDPASKTAWLAGPGRWNDPDMMEIGNGDFTSLIPAQSHFTMWCIMAAPLIAGNNVITMSAQTLSVLTNAEAIAVDQDPAGEQGVRVDGIADSAEVWSKPLGYDFTTRAVALFNRNATNPAVITCTWTNLALQAGLATVRDLWAHADLGTFTDSYTVTVLPEGTVFLKVTGTPLPPPGLGTNYLSDRQPIYTYSGFGTMAKDKSIGGQTITLDGVGYGKGIGTHAIGGQEYDLGGVCSRFQSTIGVDDEVGSHGSVIFQVMADGRKIYDSGIMTGGATAKVIDLDVTGVRRLTLGVTDTGNDVIPGSGSRNSNDHSDWANALVIVTNLAPQAPYAPTGLVASPGNAITLAWNNAVAAVSYNVKRAPGRDGPYMTITNVPVAAFTDNTVVAGTGYYYVVSAVSSLGESSNSVEAVAEVCNVPSPPVNVTATSSNAVVGLKWNASAGATSYNVSRFTGDTPPVFLANVTATNFTDVNVLPGTTNYYLVTAGNACNQSSYSSFAPAMIQILNTAPAPVWNGASTDDNWSDPANWNGINLTAGDTLIFGGSTRIDNQNDLAAGMAYPGILFNASAGSFVLSGNPVMLNGYITNNSLNAEVINLALSFSNNVTFNGGRGLLILAQALTDTLAGPGTTTVSLTGNGMLNNLLGSINGPGGTNIIALNDSSANWSLVNNASSTPVTVPWVFSINSGSFAFGSISSSPILTTTTPTGSPADNQVGGIAGGTGTFNLLAGTLTTTARFNTATALNSTGLVNQTGGTMNIGQQFQGANGGNAGEVSMVNVSGGTMNIAGGGGSFYVASRGGGTLTVSGSGTVNCGTLDVSRNASGNSMGSVGVVNLNGGMILANKVGTATANAQTGVLNGPSAVFHFNGGTLKINSSTIPFFQGSVVAPIIPISAVVQAGGAVIDSGGHTNVFAEPLQHDTALGAVADGGLIKNGSGGLILASNVSYTGNTVVNAGMLALSNSVALNSSPDLTIAAGAMLDASGRADGTLALASGQRLNGGGTISGNTSVGSGAMLAPGPAISSLMFNGNLVLNGGSATVIKVNQTTSNANDLVKVAGSLHYGGTLIITNLGAGMLAAGDSFTVFSAATFAGTFTNIIPVIPGLNLAWNTQGLSGGVLSVISSPTSAPKFGAFNFSGNRFAFNVTNGVPDWSFEILTATDLASPMSQWAGIATNHFDDRGDFNFTNSVSPGLTQQYYQLRLAPSP